jgi:hypothetical protein
MLKGAICFIGAIAMVLLAITTTNTLHHYLFVSLSIVLGLFAFGSFEPSEGNKQKQRN